MPCRMVFAWVHKLQGVSDLLSAARGSPERILPSLPGIMRAVRLAISCKNPGVIIFACSALRQLATGNKEVRSYVQQPMTTVDGSYKIYRSAWRCCLRWQPFTCTLLKGSQRTLLRRVHNKYILNVSDNSFLRIGRSWNVPFFFCN